MNRLSRLSSIIVCCLLPLCVWAEEMPVGYYDAIQGQQDSILKTTLHHIICGGERYAYGPATYHSTNGIAKADSVSPTGEIIYHKGDTLWRIGDFKAYGTWSGFLTCDRQSDGSVWDMYSATKRYFPIAGGSAAGMDIEHCFPKSWWGATENDAYRDLYHLNPADRVANNNKSNYPPGILADSNKVNNGSFFMGRDNTWGGFAFTVADEYKGDFARAYFYIATAYQDFTWGADYKKYVTNSSYLVFTPYLTQVLLDWHRTDPVSEKETDRLDAISSIQHNRNPYIEYPELVEYIWGNKQGQPIDIQSLTRTTSDLYIVPFDTVNPLAYPATDISDTAFTAHWKDQGRESYLLDVFTRTESGKNDTLISLAGINSSLVRSNSSQVQWLAEDGKTAANFTLMDGTHAICSSTTTAKRQLRLTNFGKAPAHTRLTVKCAVYKGDQTADLVIRGDNDEVLYTQPLILDDSCYTFAIPEGTQQLSILQQEIGKKGNYHRISLQQVFLYTGDYAVAESSLAGYPVSVIGTSYTVHHTLPAGQTTYYRITPAGLRTSNTIATTVPQDYHTDVPALHSPTDNSTKQIINGQLYIRRHGKTYDILGGQH